MLRKLNIGCGNDYKEGYWNIDIGNCKKDADWDITKPLPVPDGQYDHIYASHVLEHIPKAKFFQVFRELHRVLAPGGLLQFAVPKAGSDNFWTDPTHTMPFTDRTMDYLIRGKNLRENGLIYGADFEFNEVSRPQIDSVETLYFHLTKD
jgi:SAM-dependent methyltransferase